MVSSLRIYASNVTWRSIRGAPRLSEFLQYQICLRIWASHRQVSAGRRFIARSITMTMSHEISCHCGSVTATANGDPVRCFVSFKRVTRASPKLQDTHSRFGSLLLKSFLSPPFSLQYCWCDSCTLAQGAAPCVAIAMFKAKDVAISGGPTETVKVTEHRQAAQRTACAKCHTKVVNIPRGGPPLRALSPYQARGAKRTRTVRDQLMEIECLLSLWDLQTKELPSSSPNSTSFARIRSTLLA